MRAGEDRYVVKIEVFAAHDPAEITEADLEEDHMEAVSELLREMEDAGEADGVEPASRRFRYDLCPACRQRFLRDPLSRIRPRNSISARIEVSRDAAHGARKRSAPRRG